MVWLIYLYWIFWFWIANEKFACKISLSFSPHALFISQCGIFELCALHSFHWGFFLFAFRLASTPILQCSTFWTCSLIKNYEHYWFYATLANVFILLRQQKIPMRMLYYIIYPFSWCVNVKDCMSLSMCLVTVLKHVEHCTQCMLCKENLWTKKDCYNEQWR